MNENIVSKIIVLIGFLYALLASSAASKTLYRKGRSNAWRWICLFFPPAYIILFVLGNKPHLKKEKPLVIECPACIGSVSSDAKSCPHCGHPIKKRQDVKRISFIEIAGILTTSAIVIYSSWYCFSMDQETGFPKCESDYAKSMLASAVDKAPLGRVMGLSILTVKDVKIIRISSAEEICAATAILNNSTERHLIYRFYKEGGNTFIEASFSD